ncbi:hypothetical protein PSCICO_15530 [Pseudomonas cichorii]|uniref:hypothetical protein n=1 Tax=Pseudomonas cichorii TaxID=36746 RepID=UPI0019107096|nr:hypothetical protein [Pseudomonas cichorii]GFM86154.1 hypothetical protein PSCICO_15530 [Pseudomonas cichorii]
MGVEKILLALTLTGLVSVASAADSKPVNSSKPTTSQSTTAQQPRSQQPSTNNAVVTPEDIKRFKAGNVTKDEVK